MPGNICFGSSNVILATKCTAPLIGTLPEASFPAMATNMPVEMDHSQLPCNQCTFSEASIWPIVSCALSAPWSTSRSLISQTRTKYYAEPTPEPFNYASTQSISCPILLRALLVRAHARVPRTREAQEQQVNGKLEVMHVRLSRLLFKHFSTMSASQWQEHTVFCHGWMKTCTTHASGVEH